MSQHAHDSHSKHSPGYEERDAQIKPLVVFGIGLTILAAVSFFLSRQLQSTWNEMVDSRSSAHPLQDARPAPTGPRLQPTTRVDLAEHRAKEDALLNGYGWIDPESGIVHIPVERAMELTLERGLPVREAGAQR